MPEFCELVEHKKGKWRCPHCSQVPLNRGDYTRLCASGGQPSGVGNQPPQPFDPVAWFSARYAASGMTEAPTLDALLSRLDSCLSSGCEHLTDGVCTHFRGSVCKRPEHWFERLAIHGCDRLPGADK